ncbi:MAG: hypothetical protein HYY24_23475 [Verrucomicrobia bacterium]|nr:hypothetical protein [Verrucomicrobiota bacterium]
MNTSAKPTAEPPPPSKPPKPRPDVETVARKQLRFGWWSLLVFLTLGFILEVLHAFKVRAYLDVSNSTRRLMWTLAHAHGTLLALVNIAFGLTLQWLPGWEPRLRDFASTCLIAATLLIPGGFFLGGAYIHAGDPGIGIFLLPLGALLLFLGVLFTARAFARRKLPSAPSPTAGAKSSKGK